MLNQSGITKTVGATRKTMLYDTQLFFSLSCMIANTGVADADGKKIVKAGTPLKGDLSNRDVAFTVAGAEDTPVGIAMHDVDVTKGTMNGAVLVFGFVDEDKLDATVTTMLTTEMKAKLPKITFCK